MTYQKSSEKYFEPSWLSGFPYLIPFPYMYIQSKSKQKDKQTDVGDYNMFMIYWIAFKFIGIGIIPYSIKCKIIDNISTREISINIFL